MMFARVLPWMALAFALLALALGIYEWANPPFTDEQLRASLVNTWEVTTSTVRVFFIVFVGLGVVCGALARKAEGPVTRIGAYLAAATCVGALLVFLHNHIVLTQRVSRLTGQDFGALFGLL